MCEHCDRHLTACSGKLNSGSSLVDLPVRGKLKERSRAAWPNKLHRNDNPYRTECMEIVRSKALKSSGRDSGLALARTVRPIRAMIRPRHDRIYPAESHVTESEAGRWQIGRCHRGKMRCPVNHR